MNVLKVFFLMLAWAMAFNSFSAETPKRAPANEMATGVIVQQVPDTWSRTYRMVDTVNNIVCFEKDTSISCVKVEKAKTKKSE